MSKTATVYSYYSMLGEIGVKEGMVTGEVCASFERRIHLGEVHEMEDLKQEVGD